MKTTGGKTFKQKGRIRPRILGGQALSDAIRTKAKKLRQMGIKVKYDISKMTSNQKRGFNGELDTLLKRQL